MQNRTYINIMICWSKYTIFTLPLKDYTAHHIMHLKVASAGVETSKWHKTNTNIHNLAATHNKDHCFEKNRLCVENMFAMRSIQHTLHR